MKLRTAIYSTAALALASVGTLAGVAASSASAAPPVHHTIVATAVTTRVQTISPRVSVISSVDYGAKATAPGFGIVGRTTEVCLAVPHVTPPVASTILAVCSWRMTAVPATHPATSIAGTSVETGLRQVGRVTSGTGGFAGAFSILPNQTTFVNIAPRTAAATINFFTP